MLKPLTLSLSLAVAFGLTGVSKAGGLFHNEAGCTTCGIASPQGPVVSPQGPIASPQGECGPACGNECAEKKCSLFSGLGHKMNGGFYSLCNKLKPKPKCYTYEWVLKKKRVKGCHGGGCGQPACETCAVYPSGQYASPQGGYSSPQGGYSSPQAYGSGQAGYGSAQYVPTSGTIAPATPAAGDEAPPAPEVAPPTPAAAPPVGTPAPPAPPTPGSTSSLLFSTPSGN